MKQTLEDRQLVLRENQPVWKKWQQRAQKLLVKALERVLEQSTPGSTLLSENIQHGDCCRPSGAWVTELCLRLQFIASWQQHLVVTFALGAGSLLFVPWVSDQQSSRLGHQLL